jgi:hypothetical protein
MAFSSLFRKKTVQDILKQIEKMKLGHVSWQTFNGQGFDRFYCRHSGCYFLVPLVRQALMEVLLLFSFSIYGACL